MRRATFKPMAKGTLYVGTSGYSYPEWKGSFYPEDLPSKRFLEHYSGVFTTVEVNNTFYRFPSAGMLEGWREGTPDGFRFAVKANQRITHRSRLKDVEETTRDFVERCWTLEEKLAPILFQLPPYLGRDDDRLDSFLQALPPGTRYAMEFRHESWFDPAVLDRLGDAGVALCLSEGEKLDTPRSCTADFVYIRLRRDEYDEDALRDWHDWIADQLDGGRDVFAYLKHDEEGESPEYALKLLAGG